MEVLFLLSITVQQKWIDHNRIFVQTRESLSFQHGEMDNEA
ncbi:MAG TPA: hypothetical protein VE954_32355 [Oligoflexus sp.]|nr:hypothetical protein [Oligoflexus sp.]HYX37820.1 hypothetical protein [Oligoflexus sp.]